MVSEVPKHFKWCYGGKKTFIKGTTADSIIQKLNSQRLMLDLLLLSFHIQSHIKNITCVTSRIWKFMRGPPMERAIEIIFMNIFSPSIRIISTYFQKVVAKLTPTYQERKKIWIQLNVFNYFVYLFCCSNMFWKKLFSILS